MGANEDETFKRLTASREKIFKNILERNGRVANTAGDAVLAEFGSAKDAVASAVAIQKALSETNDAIPEDRKMHFRIGINLGDVIERGGDLFGDGVNIAARLQSLAEPGGICISSAMYDQVRKNTELLFEYFGEQSVKNIDGPVKVYKVVTGTSFKAPSVVKQGADGPTQEPLSTLVVAVLPFDNLSSDPEQSYFSDGLTEDLITGLATIEQLKVPARNTMFTYKGKPVNVQQLGKDIGATHVVEGSVRKSGTQFRINVQLVDASNGNHLWAKKYNRELTDIFEIQDELVHSIVTELDVRLVHGESARFWRRLTKNAEAYDLFLQATSHYYNNAVGSREEMTRSISLVDHALALDPQLIFAYSLKAILLTMTVMYGFAADPNATIADSFSLIEKAIQLDDSDAMAHGVKGYFLFMFRGQEEAAKWEIERALQLAPLLPDVNLLYSIWCIHVADFEKALTFAHRANELWKGRVSMIYVQYEVLALVGLKRFDEAKGLLKREFELGLPRFYLLVHFVVVNIALGALQEAREAFEEMSKESSGSKLENRLSFFSRLNGNLGQWYTEQYRSMGLV